MRQFVLLALIGLVLFACGDARPQQPGEAGTAWSFLAFLRQLGSGITWVGTICSITGWTLRILSVFYVPLRPLAFLWTAIGIWGIASAGTGTAILILSNPWALGGVVATIAGGVLFWHWPDIRHAWHERVALVKKVDAEEHA